MVKLTEKGQHEVDLFLTEIAAKREEILDAVKDTADDTSLPTKEDILSDIESFGDENGYYNCWGCTDSTRYDIPISLIHGEDYVVK